MFTVRLELFDKCNDEGGCCCKKIHSDCRSSSKSTHKLEVMAVEKSQHVSQQRPTVKGMIHVRLEMWGCTMCSKDNGVVKYDQEKSEVFRKGDITPPLRYCTCAPISRVLENISRIKTIVLFFTQK